MALAAAALAACGPCGYGAGRRQADAGHDAGPASTEPALQTGTVEGVVRLAEGKELPMLPEPPPPMAPWPPSCTPVGPADRTPVRLGDGRGLEGMLVSASAFQGSPPHEPRTIEVHIRDCRLTPTFVDATRGDTIELRNDVDNPFIPAFSGGGDGIAQALLHQHVRSLDLERGGVHEIACTWGAPCGKTQVAVLYHPVHTTTGAGGRFRLEHVPAGEVEIHAWHPLFHDVMQRVTVVAGQTARITLTPEPSPPPPPTPPEPLPPGAPF